MSMPATFMPVRLIRGGAMKLFPVRGGVHPDYRKEKTAAAAIVALPLPQALYLPLPFPAPCRVYGCHDSMAERAKQIVFLGDLAQ